MSKEQAPEKKKTFFGKSLEVLGNIHYAIGVVAAAGFAIVHSAGLAAVAGWEFVSGFVHKEVGKNLEKKRGVARPSGKLALST